MDVFSQYHIRLQALVSGTPASRGDKSLVRLRPGLLGVPGSPWRGDLLTLAGINHTDPVATIGGPSLKTRGSPGRGLDLQRPVFRTGSRERYS
jgi:hypothetical protein